MANFFSLHLLSQDLGFGRYISHAIILLFFGSYVLPKISSSFVGIFFLSFGVICICIAARGSGGLSNSFWVCVATCGGRSTRN